MAFDATPGPLSALVQVQASEIREHVAWFMSLVPDSDKKKKKDKKSPKRHSTPDGKKDRGGSTHYKERIGQFTLAEMAACIDEIRNEEADAKAARTKPRSRNEICKDHKLFQATQIYLFGLWRQDLLFGLFR